MEQSVSLWCEEEEAQGFVLEEKQNRGTSFRVQVRPQVQSLVRTPLAEAPVQTPAQTQTRTPAWPPQLTPLAENLVRTPLAEAPVPCAWDPSILGPRAVSRLLELELKYLPSVLYVRLIQGAPQSRDELVKWAMEVCSDAGCEEQVFPLSVSLLDRFLGVSLSVPAASPFCLAAACVLTASKLSECETLPADTLCAAAGYSFSSQSLRDMERVVVATLRWDLASVTPQDFLPHFLSAAVTSSSCDGADLAVTVRRHSDTLAALCVSDARFLGAPPSLLAAGALCCALKGLGTTQALELTTERVAHLCQTDPAVLQCYSEMIEFVLRERLSGAPQSAPSQKEEELMEPPRPGTPADMTDIDF